MNEDLKTPFRKITPDDDFAMADVIRIVMPEFGACGEGFAIEDAEVDSLSEAYDGPRSDYWVIEHQGQVSGGGGFAALDGGPSDVCEIRKMYFKTEVRGRGWGRALLETILSGARASGYRRAYLETLVGMDAAMGLYESLGFIDLDEPLGTTGHYGCNRWMMLELDEGNEQ